MNNHPLTVDDENFYKVVLNELTNMEAFLKPLYHQVVKWRAKTAMLRASLASQCVPLIIEFKESAGTQNLTELLAQFEELDKLNTTLEEKSCQS